MKNVLFIVFVMFVIIVFGALGGRALDQEFAQQDAAIPEELRGIAEFHPANLQGFESTSIHGLPWNCGQSSWKIDTFEVQVVTASGDNLLFVCQDKQPMVKFCSRGVIISPPGEHDKCK